MPEGEVNVLVEPVVGVRCADGARMAMSLPEVMEGLGDDRISSFTALQRHQAHAWHAFLVQLGAAALDRAGIEDARQSASRWREILRTLTPKGDEAWCLIVDDPAIPAFFQPPMPAAILAKASEIVAPDDLDVLVTSKNHDVKQRRVGASMPEHWIYAIVTLQTMQGFLGRGNYGIARMNGGFGSRPEVAFRPAHALGRRFVRDIGAALRARESLIETYDFEPRGKVLLWLDPWDGKKSIPLRSCDPFFVEICRLVRLAKREGGMVARFVPSECARIDAKAVNGCTGDLWTPIQKAAAKALTVSDRGFTYKMLQALLIGGEFTRGAAFKSQPDDGADCVFSVSTLVRGSGVTGGFHERVIPIASDRIEALDANTSAMALRAKAWIADVATLQYSVLKPALIALIKNRGGDPEKKVEKSVQKDPRLDAWIGRHEAGIDRIFLERLLSTIGADDDDVRADWQKLIIELGREVLSQAIDEASRPSARRYCAEADAESCFYFMCRKSFPALYPPSRGGDK